METERLINLEAFRKKNHLSQKDVAEFLKTSPAFISLVENGRSKLSDEKLHDLMMSDWDTSDLVPAYNRVTEAWKEYNQARGITEFWPLEDKDPFGLGEATMSGLFYGFFGVDNKMADSILSAVPNISREWLLYGEGSRYLNQESSLEARVDELERLVKDLRAQLVAVKRHVGMKR